VAQQKVERRLAAVVAADVTENGWLTCIDENRVRRRDGMTLLAGGAAVGWPVATHGQQPMVKSIGSAC
jgi:hypothetical protein